MRRIILFLAVFVAACTAKPGGDIETDLNRRIGAGGLSGRALADAYIDRGLLRAATKNLDGAIADFDAAIATAPDLAEAYVWRGIALDGKGDSARARAEFDRALTIDPDDWFAQGSLGMLMAKTGEEDAALATLARAIELGMPHSGEYFVREVRQYQATVPMPKGPPATGTAGQQLSSSAANQLALFRIARAGIFLERNDADAALAESRAAVGVAPDSGAAQWNLVFVLAELGRCEEAWNQTEALGSKTGFYLFQPKSKSECAELLKFRDALRS